MPGHRGGFSRLGSPAANLKPGIPRFSDSEISAKSGSGRNPEYFPDPGGLIRIGRIPAIFPAELESGRDVAGSFGDSGLRLAS
jgi:hypothetical protein